MEPTGEGGFEHLVAMLLAAETGQGCRIAGSGRQDGMDVAVERNAFANRINAECKHYGKATLNQRDLVAGLQQALAASEFDLWVLVVSCPFNATREAELLAMAADRGVECLFIDRAKGDLSRLEALMACHAAVVERFRAAHHPDVDGVRLAAQLATIARDARFPGLRTALRAKLNGTLLGFEDARRRMVAFLRSTLGDADGARAELGQALAINGPDARKVTRRGVGDALDAWWNPGPAGHAAVVGEGLMGKSWAALDWLDARLEAAGFPLVVPVVASGTLIAPGESLAEVLPRVLACTVGTMDVAGWNRRLERWLSPSSDRRPTVLVLVDGLNEKPELLWTSVLAPLGRREWRDRVHALVTDRAAHWSRECRTLEMAGGFRPIPVGRYDDGEFASALVAAGIALEDVPEGSLRDIARIPGYCGLLCTHLDAMLGEGDPTVEHLVMLDVAERRSANLGYPLTLDAFNEVVAHAARVYRDGAGDFDQAAIRALCPDPHFSPAIYEELVGGGVFVRREDRGQPLWRVDRTRLVYGIGLLLADDLRARAEAGEEAPALAEYVAAWMEPHAGDDLKVEALGSALFHAHLQGGYPAAPRCELLAAWLRSRNASAPSRHAISAYIVRRPADFIAMVEPFWRSTSGDQAAAQEFLARAFLIHRDRVAVRAELIAACEGWMGFVHRSGPPLLRHGEEATARMRAAIEARAGAPLRPGPMDHLGRRLEVVLNSGLLRLKRLVLLIASHGEVAPFAPALATWAAASALHGVAMEADLVDWTVRLATDEAELGPIALELAAGLARYGDGGRLAADILARRLGSAAASDFRRDHPPLRDEAHEERMRSHREDPCASMWAWTEEERVHCLGRADVSLRNVLRGAGKAGADPGAPMPAPAVAAVELALCDVDPAKLFSEFSENGESRLFGDLSPVLETDAPRSLAEVVRAAVRSLPDRTPEGVRQLAIRLPEYSPLLRGAETEVLRATLDALRAGSADWKTPDARSPERPDQVAEAFLTLSLLVHLDPTGRIEEVLSRPEHAIDLLDIEGCIDVLPPEDFARTLASFAEAAPVGKRRRLWLAPLLSGQAGADALSDDANAELARVAAEGDGHLRAFALRYADLTHNAAATASALATGGSYAGTDAPGEALWGARCLVRVAPTTPFAEGAARLDPATLGRFLVARGASPEDVASYAEILEAGVRGILDAAAAPPPGVVVNVPPPQGALGNDSPSFVEEDGGGMTLTSSDATWGGRGASVSLADILTSSLDLFERARSREDRDAAIFDARRHAAWAWFGRSFEPASLTAVLAERPDLLRSWSDAALAGGAAGEGARRRLGSFYAALSEAAFAVDPASAVELWRLLRSDRGAPALIDLLALPFRAPPCPATEATGTEALLACVDDDAIATIAVAAAMYGRTAWLRETIAALAGSDRLRDRAYGLALASFSDLPVADFEEVVEGARCEGTWLADRLEGWRAANRSNAWARGWYRRFLKEGDPDLWWSCLRSALRCADARFACWKALLEAEGPAPDRRKAIHLAVNARDVASALDRSHGRRATLFGLKRAPGQVHPFLDV